MKKITKILCSIFATALVAIAAVGCSTPNWIKRIGCNHVYDSGTVTKEATCEKTGTLTYKCEKCKKKATEIIPAKGHVEEILAAVEATCQTTGLKSGTKCSVCEKILVPQVEIPIRDHLTVIDAAYAATCLLSGKTEGTHCQWCEKILTAQEVIPAIGHTDEIIPAVAATCTTAGLTEGVQCATCGEVFTSQVEIPATGHTDADEDGNCDSCGALTEAYINSTLSSLASGTQSHTVALAYTQPNYETDPTAVPIDNNLAVTSGNYYKAQLGYMDDGWEITVSGIHVNADKTVSYGDIALPSVVTEDNQYVYFYVPSDVELQGETINDAYASLCEFGLVVLYSEEVSTTLTALASGMQSFTTENLVDSGYNLTSPIESGYYYRFAPSSGLISGYPDGLGITRDEVLFFNPVDNTVTFYGSEVQMTVTEDTKYVYFYLPDVGYTNNDIDSIFASVCGFEKVIFSETETVATLSLRNVPATQSEIICSAEDIFANSVWTLSY